VAVVTLLRGRHSHLAGQIRGLRCQTHSPDAYVVVAIDDPAAHDVARELSPADWKVLTPALSRRGGRLPLSAARNLGAATAVAAGAEHLVFLDVDVIPDPTLVARYCEVLSDASVGKGPRVLCGDVAYELAPAEAGAHAGADRRPRHHPARPALPPGQVTVIDDVTLFWSLSFAVSARDFVIVGGFDEDYVGYGAEDTDFGQRLSRRQGHLLFIGGAGGVHQYHPSPSPPVQHVDDIVVNANVFADKWGWWPMQSWLDQFGDLGLARRGATGRWETTSAVSRTLAPAAVDRGDRGVPGVTT